MKKTIQPKLFDKDDLTKLGKYRPDGPVISLYLPVIPEKFHKTWESLYHIQKSKLKESELKEIMKKDILNALGEIDAYLHNLYEADRGNTLIIFKELGQFLRSYEVPVLMPGELNLTDIFYLRPIKDIYLGDGYIFVALVDRTKTEFFALNWGRFFKDYGLSEYEVPQKIKGGGESWKGLKEKNVLRHIEWHLHEHMKKSSDDLYMIFRKEKFKKLIVGGHKEVIGKFEKTLHPELKNLIIKRFHAEPDLFLSEVRRDGISAIERHLI